MKRAAVRAPGRPPLAANETSVPVHVRMPAREYDALDKRARHARVSVPEIIRRDLRAAEYKNQK